MLTRIQRRLHDDDGISLIEMMIALFVLAFAVMAMTSTLITSVAAAGRNETQVKATAFAQERLEQLQALPYNLVAHTSDDVDAISSTGRFEGEEVVGAADDTNPLLPVYRLTAVDRDNRTFDLETIVTWVSDGEVGTAYKRLIVIVSWDDRGTARTQRFEAVRAATPDEQALDGLSIFVTGVFRDSAEISSTDCYPVSGASCGANASAVRIRAVTTEPVGSVRLLYTERDGTLRQPLMTYYPDRGAWETVISAGSRRFVNGETTFTVRAVDPDDSTNVVEDEGRSVFLHQLAVHDLTATPDLVCVDAAGTLVEPLTLRANLVGADVNIEGAGLPIHWTSQPPTAGSTADAMLLMESAEVWGGRFSLELLAGADLPPFQTTRVDDDGNTFVTLWVGPMSTTVTEAMPTPLPSIELPIMTPAEGTSTCSTT